MKSRALRQHIHGAHGHQTHPRIPGHSRRARDGRAGGRRWPRPVGGGRVARARRGLWDRAGGDSRRSAAHRADGHHGGIGDGGCWGNRVPRARRGEDHPQESEAGHRRRAAGDLWIYICCGHRAHRLSAAAGHLRSGAREWHPPRAPDGGGYDRFTTGHHREPGVGGDGGDDRPARDARHRARADSPHLRASPHCSRC